MSVPNPPGCEPGGGGVVFRLYTPVVAPGAKTLCTQREFSVIETMPASEKPRVIDTNDVLDVLEDAREPFLSTGEVTERLPASKPTVRDRLQSLEEEGLVRYRVLGANTPAWYLPDLENRRLPEYGDGETPDDDGDAPERETEQDDVVDETKTAPGYDERGATLSTVSLVLLLFVPVLLAVDAVGTAALASGLGGGYAFLWSLGYDGRAAHHLTRAKQKYSKAGGVSGFFIRLFDTDDGEPPDSLVERAARLRIYSVTFLFVSAVFSSPVWVSYYLAAAGFGTWEPIINFLGAGTISSVLAAALLVMLTGLFLAGVSAIASIVLISAEIDKLAYNTRARLGEIRKNREGESN